jgi:putative flippase GtrA
VLWLAVRAGTSPYAGRVVSLAAAIIYTWWLNRRLTFATAAPPTWREFGHYVVVSLAGAVINYAIYSAALALGAPLWLGFILGTGIAAVFNFLRYRALLGDAASEGRLPT